MQELKKIYWNRPKCYPSKIRCGMRNMRKHLNNTVRRHKFKNYNWNETEATYSNTTFSDKRNTSKLIGQTKQTFKKLLNVATTRLWKKVQETFTTLSKKLIYWLHTPCFKQKNGDLSKTIENCLGYWYEVNIFKIFLIVHYTLINVHQKTLSSKLNRIQLSIN